MCRYSVSESTMIIVKCDNSKIEFSVVALSNQKVLDTNCFYVNKSYPQFFRLCYSPHKFHKQTTLFYM